jgi:hypothetical protein
LVAIDVFVPLPARTVSQLVGTASFMVGNSYGTSENYAGVIDELAVYDKALSTSRIIAHYFAGVSR